MNWINTPNSSNISRYAYDAQSQILRVEFLHGAIYDYFDVPDHVYNLMESADSIGKFLAQEIKGCYRYARV